MREERKIIRKGNEIEVKNNSVNLNGVEIFNMDKMNPIPMFWENSFEGIEIEGTFETIGVLDGTPEVNLDISLNQTSFDITFLVDLENKTIGDVCVSEIFEITELPSIHPHEDSTFETEDLY